MKVPLNLATSPLENNRRFLLGAGILGTVALALLLGLSVYTFRAWSYNRETRQQISRLQGEMRDLRRERRDLEQFFQQRDTRQVTERAALLNGLIDQRSFPWTKVFMDLERLLPPGVRVVSISPRLHEGRAEVRLLVGAASDELKLRFLRTLDEAPEFTGIRVLGESRPDRRGDGDPVRLELIAWYVSP